jgi:hypothetical protein
MKKSITDLTTELHEIIHDCYELSELPIGDVFIGYQLFVSSVLEEKTPTGRNRYNKQYQPFFNAIFNELKGVYERKTIVYGYWYEGEFYTTYRKTHASRLVNNLRTTEELHDLKLSQDKWNSLQRGMYYAANPKRVYY